MGTLNFDVFLMVELGLSVKFGGAISSSSLTAEFSALSTAND